MRSLKGEKIILLKILKKVFNSSIEKIEFIEESSIIEEYNFSMIKVRVYYKDERTEQLCLRLIKGGKIKESIFCYWSLLYEEYLKNNKDKSNLQKAIITQVTSKKSSSCIILKLNAKLNYYAEINLIELRSFYENNIEYERWLDSLEIKYDDILFIGKKMY